MIWQTVNFEETLQADVIAEVMSARLEETPNSLVFSRKSEFLHTLPMRSIPFKVVCLLGMNEADYPRSHTPNSFDLMQYHHQKAIVFVEMMTVTYSLRLCSPQDPIFM